MTRAEPHATTRLRLEPVTRDDLDDIAHLHADARVMDWLGGVQDAAAVEAFVDRAAAHWHRHGFGFWSLRERHGGRFVGLAGLLVPRFEAPFTPCVEVSWRLAPAAWGLGYASEAGRATLAVGFDDLGLDEIVAFTARHNTRSRAVMARLGMRHDATADFDHPQLAPGHRLRRHVLYRVAPAEVRH